MPDSRPPIAEDVAIARKMLADNTAVIALCPAGGVDTWPVALRIGRAVEALGHGSLVLVRAIGSGTAQPREGEPPFSTRPLPEDPGLVELTLPLADHPSQRTTNLNRALPLARGRFAHLLVDLAGCMEHLREVVDLFDGFVSVVAAGRTRERELVTLVELLPTSRHLGTLLVDE